MVSETEDSTLHRAASEVKVVSSRVSAKEGSIVPEAASEAFITEPSLVSATDDSTLLKAASEVKVVSSMVSAKEGSIVPEAASEAFITDKDTVVSQVSEASVEGLSTVIETFSVSEVAARMSVVLVRSDVVVPVNVELEDELTVRELSNNKI